MNVNNLETTDANKKHKIKSWILKGIFSFNILLLIIKNIKQVPIKVSTVAIPVFIVSYFSLINKIFKYLGLACVAIIVICMIVYVISLI